MKKVVFLMILSLSYFYHAKAQDKKLDCFVGNFNTSKNGAAAMHAIETRNIDSIKPLLLVSKKSKIDEASLLQKIDSLHKLLPQLNPAVKSRSEFIEKSSIVTNNCYYERTYYNIKGGVRIKYQLQVKLDMDVNGKITDIEFIAPQMITNRDKLILAREKEEKKKK